MKVRKFPKGELIFDLSRNSKLFLIFKGQKPQNAYILLKGEIGIYKPKQLDKLNKEIAVLQMKRSQLFYDK